MVYSFRLLANIDTNRAEYTFISLYNSTWKQTKINDFSCTSADLRSTCFVLHRLFYRIIEVHSFYIRGG